MKRSVILSAIGLAAALLLALRFYEDGGLATDSVEAPSDEVAKLNDPSIPTAATKPVVQQRSEHKSVLEVPAPLPPKDAERADAGNYDHPTRLYGVSGVLFYAAVLDESKRDTLSAVSKIRAVTKVDDVTAWKFLDYISEAQDDLNLYQRESVNLLCDRRSEIKDISQLAFALGSTDAGVEARRAQLTRGAEAVLGVDGMRNFEIYMSGKDRRKKPSTPDNEGKLRQMQKSAPELLALFCDKRQDQ